MTENHYHRPDLINFFYKCFSLSHRKRRQNKNWKSFVIFKFVQNTVWNLFKTIPLTTKYLNELHEQVIKHVQGQKRVAAKKYSFSEGCHQQIWIPDHEKLLAINRNKNKMQHGQCISTKYTKIEWWSIGTKEGQMDHTPTKALLFAFAWMHLHH